MRFSLDRFRRRQQLDRSTLRIGQLGCQTTRKGMLVSLQPADDILVELRSISGTIALNSVKPPRRDPSGWSAGIPAHLSPTSGCVPS